MLNIRCRGFLLRDILQQNIFYEHIINLYYQKSTICYHLFHYFSEITFKSMPYVKLERITF